MGAWGTGIFEDDTTCDVRDDFMDYLEEGKSAKEATDIILSEYLAEYDLDEDLEEISLVYIGLSAIQTEKRCLQENVRTMTISLIERGADLELWRDADDDFVGREKILREWKQKLINEK